MCNKSHEPFTIQPATEEGCHEVAHSRILWNRLIAGTFSPKETGHQRQRQPWNDGSTLGGTKWAQSYGEITGQQQEH